MGSLLNRAIQQGTVSAARQPQQTPQNPGGFQGFVQGIANPFLKAASSVQGFVGGVGELGAAGLSALTGDKAGAAQHVSQANQELTKKRDYGYFGSTRPVGIDQNTGQGLSGTDWAKDVVGTGAEIGSYAAPVAGITRGTTLGTKVLGGAIGGSVGGALGGAGQELQKSGSTAGSVLGSGAMGGVLGGVTGGILPVASTLARKAGGAALQGLGKATGTGETALKEVFENPSVIKYVRRAGKEGIEDVQFSALSSAQKALRNVVKDRGDEYVTRLAKVKANPTDLFNSLETVRQSSVKNLMDEFGVKFSGNGKKLNNLDFSSSFIEEKQNVISNAFNKLMGWTDTSAAGIDKLKKGIGTLRDQAKDSPPAYALLNKMYDDTRSVLENNVKGYKEMTKSYNEASNFIKQVNSILSLKKSGERPDIAVNKLIGSLRQNNETRLALLRVLGQKGDKNIVDQLVGAQLAPIAPRGLSGAIAGAAGPTVTASMFFSPQTIPLFLITLAASSPRLVAEALALLGKVKGNVIPPQIQQGLKNIYIQAVREAMQSGSSSN